MNPVIRAVVVLGVTTLLTTPTLAEEQAPWPPSDGRVIGGILAVVNEDPVTVYELQRSLGPFRARLSQQQFRSGDEDESMPKRVLESLIDDRLIQAQAREMDVSVSDAKVDERIQRLKEKNAWTEEQLAKRLRRHGFASIADYRSHVREELLKRQVLSIKVAAQVNVDPDEVEQEFEKRIAGESGLQERRASHILLRVDEMASSKQVEAARRKLEKLRDRIVSGEASFADLARRHSEDTNASAGGDLGWFARGDLNPRFEEAVWKLDEQGDVSQPVQTQYGLHLIELTGIRQRDRLPDEKKKKMRRRIRQKLRKEDLERRYDDWMRTLRRDAYIRVHEELLQLVEERMPASRPGI